MATPVFEHNILFNANCWNPSETRLLHGEKIHFSSNLESCGDRYLIKRNSLFSMRLLDLVLQRVTFELNDGEKEVIIRGFGEGNPFVLCQHVDWPSKVADIKKNRGNYKEIFDSIQQVDSTPEELLAAYREFLPVYNLELPEHLESKSLSPLDEIFPEKELSIQTERELAALFQILLTRNFDYDESQYHGPTWEEQDARQLFCYIPNSDDEDFSKKAITQIGAIMKILPRSTWKHLTLTYGNQRTYCEINQSNDRVLPTFTNIRFKSFEKSFQLGSLLTLNDLIKQRMALDINNICFVLAQLYFSDKPGYEQLWLRISEAIEKANFKTFIDIFAQEAPLVAPPAASLPVATGMDNQETSIARGDIYKRVVQDNILLLKASGGMINIAALEYIVKRELAFQLSNNLLSDSDVRTIVQMLTDEYPEMIIRNEQGRVLIN